MIRHCISLLLICLLSGGVYSQVKQDPAEAAANFKSDGCSLFPDGNYRMCCEEHDKAYLIGGSLKARRDADKELYDCVRSKGNGKLLASMIFVGTSIGGVSFLPTPFRWGFGNKYPYKEPSKPKPKTKSATGR